MKQEIRHIVFLTPGFPESEQDSTTIPALQSYLKALTKALPKTKITVLSFQFPFSKTTYDWNGIEVIPLNGQNKRYKKLWIWFIALQKVKQLNRQSPITCLHSLWIGECSFVGNKLSKQLKIPLLVTVMGQDAKQNNPYVKQLAKSNVKIISLSINQYDLLIKNYRITSQLIPWALNPTEFISPSQSSIDILSVGSLNSVKNHQKFIQIIASLVKAFPSLKVEIIGDGNQAELVQIINKRGLTKNILLKGKLPRNEVLKKMSQSNILLHTSDYESFGFVFSEALMSGMCIVSNAVGIAHELPQWSVCQSDEAMTDACYSFLASPLKKQQIMLHKEEEMIAAYLKLYNAKG